MRDREKGERSYGHMSNYPIKSKLPILVLLFLWMGLLIYLSGVPHLFAGTQNWLIRKLGHAVAYGILTYLLWKNSYFVTKKLHIQTALCIGIVIVTAVYDEIHQISIPGRSGNYKGILFDILGMTLVLGVLNIVQRRTKSHYTV